MHVFVRSLPLPLVLLVFAACASTPVAAPPPAPAPAPDIPLALTVENARAIPRGLDSVALSFDLTAKNADSRAVEMESIKWELFIDGEKKAEELKTYVVQLAPDESTGIKGECLVTIPGAALDEAAFKLVASAARRAGDGTSIVSKAESSGRFPVIREPRFSILSIKIKKAELINTKFEVKLRIENPNAVPLRLKALEYELFGEGRLWTDGENAETIPVEANGTTDKKLMLTMNFINMKRELLDQVIRLEIVDYRFKGEAKICTELPEFPEFVMPYDLSGRTSVVE